MAPPADWQAVILADVIEIVLSGHQSPITVKAALWKLRQRRWINPRFSRLSEADAHEIKSAVSEFDLPAGAILTWAAILSRLSILVPVLGDRWILHPMIISQVYATRSANKLK